MAAGAEYLASIYGTEKDKCVRCSHHALPSRDLTLQCACLSLEVAGIGVAFGTQVRAHAPSHTHSLPLLGRQPGSLGRDTFTCCHCGHHHCSAKMLARACVRVGTGKMRVFCKHSTTPSHSLDASPSCTTTTHTTPHTHTQSQLLVLPQDWRVSPWRPLLASAQQTDVQPGASALLSSACRGVPLAQMADALFFFLRPFSRVSSLCPPCSSGCAVVTHTGISTMLSRQTVLMTNLYQNPALITGADGK
jgi:hypothetical protein